MSAHHTIGPDAALASARFHQEQGMQHDEPTQAELDLRARAPRREQFDSDDEYEEAVGYYRSHVGRIIGMLQAQRRRRTA